MVRGCRVEHRMILPDRVELLDRIVAQRYADELRAELRRPASRGPQTQVHPVYRRSRLPPAAARCIREGVLWR